MKTFVQDDPRLRTRVIRYLKDEEGEERTLDEIAKGTGLSVDDVKRGIDHNHFIDSLKPNLYYGVIQKIEVEGKVTYRFNRAQYLQNRSRWINASGKKRGGGGNNNLPQIPKPGLGWLKRKGKGD